MRRIITTTTLILGITLSTFSQVPYFQILLDPPAGQNIGEGIAADANGNVVMLTTQLGAPVDGTILTSMDNTGAVNWSVRLENSGNIFMMRDIVRNSSDNGYVLFGETNDGQQVAAAMEIDDNGNVVWARRFSFTVGISPGNDIAPSSDGGYLASVGYSSGGSNRVAVMKLSSTGTLQWVREVSSADADMYEVYDIKEKPGGGYYVVVAGYNMMFGYAESFLVELSTSGTLVNFASLPQLSGGDVNIDGVIPKPSGGAIVVGSTIPGSSNEPILIDLTSSLTINQTMTYTAGAGTGFLFRDIHPDPNSNGYILFATAFDAAFGASDIGIVKLDEFFAPQSAMLYGNSFNNDFTDGMVLPDGSVLLASIQMDPPTPGSEQARFISVDPSLSSGCAEGAVSLTENPQTYSTSATTLSSGVPAFTSGTLVLNNSGIGMNKNELCLTQPCNITITGNVTDDDCLEGTGAIDITVSNGTAPYTYSWSNSATTEDLTNIGPGSYIVTVNDADGCSQQATYTVASGPGGPDAQGSVTDPTCNGGADGAIDITIATLNTSGYTVDWTGPNGFTSNALDIAGLEAGQYEIIITDDNGCTWEATYFLTDPSAITYTLWVLEDASCNGGSDGEISISASGGGGITYQWDAAAGNQTTATATGLSAGTYSVTVTNGDGCSEVFSFTVGEPAAVAVTGNVTDVTCFGDMNGAIDITASGGTPPYSYAWSHGNNLQDQFGLSSGSYTVQVTDDNGCQVTETFVVNEPAAISIGSSTVSATCNGNCDGEATATPSGGTSPYTYQWDDASNQTTQTATGLCAGTYNVLVSDANNCVETQIMTVGEPASLVVATAVVPTECQLDNGSASAAVTGGTSPYSYAWSSGGTSVSESNLGIGTYTVDVTDDNGCTAQGTATVGDTTLGVDICVVKVDTTSTHNVVAWEKPAATNIEGFNVYRDVVGTYTYIGFTPFDSLSQFIDTTNNVNPNNTSYRYKISVVDSCGNESVLSDFHETIHLTVNQGGGGVWNLIWDNYIGIGFSHYRIMRDTIGNDQFVAIDSVTNANMTYTDNSPGSTYSNYRIDIVLDDPCVSTRANNHNTTRSNRYNPQNPPNGISEFGSMGDAMVFPNPNEGQFTLEINSTFEGQAVMEMYDINGRLVVDRQLTMTTGTRRYPVEATSIERGFYILVVRSDAGMIRIPVEVQK